MWYVSIAYIIIYILTEYQVYGRPATSYRGHATQRYHNYAPPSIDTSHLSQDDLDEIYASEQWKLVALLGGFVLLTAVMFWEYIYAFLCCRDIKSVLSWSRSSRGDNSSRHGPGDHGQHGDGDGDDEDDEFYGRFKSRFRQDFVETDDVYYGPGSLAQGCDRAIIDGDGDGDGDGDCDDGDSSCYSAYEDSQSHSGYGNDHHDDYDYHGSDDGSHHAANNGMHSRKRNSLLTDSAKDLLRRTSSQDSYQ
jgi:hypothetical protein